MFLDTKLHYLLQGVQQRTNLGQGKEHLYYVLLGYGGDQANVEGEFDRQHAQQSKTTTLNSLILMHSCPNDNWSY